MPKLCRKRSKARTILWDNRVEYFRAPACTQANSKASETQHKSGCQATAFATNLQVADVGHRSDFLEASATNIETRRNVFIKKDGEVGALGLDLASVDPRRYVARIASALIHISQKKQ